MIHLKSARVPPDLAFSAIYLRDGISYIAMSENDYNAQMRLLSLIELIDEENFNAAIGALTASPARFSQLGLGGSALQSNFGISSAFTTLAGNAPAAYYDNTIFPATALTSGTVFASAPGTAPASSMDSLNHFWAMATNKGVSANIGTVRGFYVSNAIAVGTNNYAFCTDLLSGVGRYQFAGLGTAKSYLGGPLGILAEADTVGKASMLVLGAGNVFPTTETTGHVIRLDMTAPPTMTASLIGVRSLLRSSAATYTIGNVTHFQADTTALGAGSTITNVYGFSALNTMAVGANNVGFFSNILAASGSWQVYAGGTAQSLFGGTTFFSKSVCIGASIQGFECLKVWANNATGGSTIASGITLTGAFGSFATSSVSAFLSDFTSPSGGTGTANHYLAGNLNNGGGTLSAAVGFNVANAAVAGANVGYGFYSGVNAGTNKWAFYAGGTADSYLGGDLYMANGKALRINGNQVVGGRKTGWTLSTGTALRTGFDTATATLTQVAQTVKALIDDLHATSAGHGLIGA